MKIEVIHLEVAELDEEEQEEEMEEVEEDSAMEERSLNASIVKIWACSKDCRFKNNQQASCAEEKEADENMFYACQSASEQKNNVWFLDGGCTNHMTGNKNIFLDMDTTINSQVKMGNGDLVNVKGKAQLASKLKWEPTLEQNLLSVGQLVEHGYKLHFEDNECTIYDKERRRNLLSIVFKYVENVALRMEDVEETWLWHRRFGHLNFNSLKMLCQRKMVQGLPNTIEEKNEVCDGCALGNRLESKEGIGVSSHDICGPMSTPSQGNNKYFVLFIDDFTRMTWVFFMKQKSEQSGCYIKTLRSERNGIYLSQFGNFCEDEGVERQLTVAYTPQQNGVVERKNQTVMEMAKAMLYEKGLPKIFGLKRLTLMYLLNRCPTKALLNKTPIEAWSGRKPSVRHFKVFGCLCYSQVPKERRSKLDETSEKCIFMGYSSQSKGYRLYNLKTNKLIISRDVIFDEKAAWNWEEGKILKKTILVDELQTKAPVETGNGSTSTSSPQESPKSVPLSPSIESPTSSSSSPSSTPRKMRSLADVYERCNLCIVEPQTMEKEIDVIEKNETWQLVEKPKDKEIIGVKWIFRVKYHSDGRVQRLKARLVAKGYLQQPGVDFHETFAPVARLDTIRTIIAVAAQKGWLLYQLDIKSAFLNGKLEEEIYVEQPQGFVVDGEENKVYKLKKALYGLKQAPRAWYTQIDNYFIENGFIRSKSEPTLYVKSKDNSQILIVALYVDDLIFLEMMRRCDMGLLHYFWELKSIKKKMVCLFVKEVFVNEKLRKEDGGKMVDETHFRSLVGNLLYLTATRPDIMFAASLLSRFMHYPSHLHLGAAKRVLRYLHGTVELGIKYFRNIEVKLIGHCDSDWGGCIDDMKSTSGYAFSLGSGVISWVSKKQGSVAQSSAEAEYISASLATSQAIWLRRILEDIKEKQNEATYLLCDNKSAIAIAKNYVFHSRTRHIAVKYHFIKEAISDGEVQLMYCKSEEQVADIFTKALPLEKLVHFRKLLGVEKHHIRGENWLSCFHVERFTQVKSLCIWSVTSCYSSIFSFYSLSLFQAETAANNSNQKFMPSLQIPSQYFPNDVSRSPDKLSHGNDPLGANCVLATF
ncbi:hypothetical protein AAG906_004621 [Vitis piasezkii]